jgi:hypothetical protein
VCSPTSHATDVGHGDHRALVEKPRFTPVALESLKLPIHVAPALLAGLDARTEAGRLGVFSSQLNFAISSVETSRAV